MKNKDHVFLLLGGNIGDVAETFRRARNEINQFARISRQSSLYKTQAWGMENASDFFNQALLLTTDLTPQNLLKRLKALEQDMGRPQKKTAGNEYTSRTLDIDILLWGNSIIDEDELKIPHPRMHLRNFTLIPLNEIAPDFEHPGLKLKVNELLEQCTDTLKVEKR